MRASRQHNQLASMRKTLDEMFLFHSVAHRSYEPRVIVFQMRDNHIDAPGYS
jgi:hypothetical protein